jgi:NitT/TauT family transport system ATP-binding protein
LTDATVAGAVQERPIIRAEHVDHYYEGQSGWIHALSDVSFEIPRKEFLCVIGPSGCGKSTFLKIVAGLVKPSSGKVLLNEAPIAGPGPDRGIVFQEPALFAWRTVLENVEFGLEMQKMPKAEARRRAQSILEIVGLGHVMNLYPYQLSGGMRHRVAVARAWALPNADLLLMDEPFSAIDAINRMTLQDYLVDTWMREKRTVLYVTHDIDEAVYLADRILLMRPSPGRIGRFFSVDMPRPRDRNSPAFNALKSLITEEMHRSADPSEDSEAVVELAV